MIIMLYKLLLIDCINSSRTSAVIAGVLLSTLSTRKCELHIYNDKENSQLSKTDHIIYIFNLFISYL
jgi:hypothetical protein